MPNKRLLRCRACRLTWFPQGGPAAACPACGGNEIGAAFELFYLGMMLIALGLIGWVWPLIGQVPGAEHREAAIPAVINAKKPTAEVERGPAQGQPVTFRRGEKVTIAKKDDRRVLVKDRRGNQVYVSPKKVKRRQKAKTKTRSQHVQR